MPTVSPTPPPAQAPPIQIPAPNVPISKVQPIFTTSITSVTGAPPAGVSPLLNGYNPVASGAGSITASLVTQPTTAINTSNISAALLGSTTSEAVPPSYNSSIPQPFPFISTAQSTMAGMPPPPFSSMPPVQGSAAQSTMPSSFYTPQAKVELPKPGGLMNMGGGNTGLQSQFIPTPPTIGSQPQPQQPFASPFALSNFPAPSSLPGGELSIFCIVFSG